MASRLLMTVVNGHSSGGRTTDRQNERYLFRTTGSMTLMQYSFSWDEGVWRGHTKGHPDYQAQGESFEELQLKLHWKHLDLDSSFIRSVNSDRHGVTAVKR